MNIFLDIDCSAVFFSSASSFSSSRNSLFMSEAHFLNRSFVSLVLHFPAVYILDMNPLSDIYLDEILFQGLPLCLIASLVCRRLVHTSFLSFSSCGNGIQALTRPGQMSYHWTAPWMWSLSFPGAFKLLSCRSVIKYRIGYCVLFHLYNSNCHGV